jgi:hypothetical protein
LGPSVSSSQLFPSRTEPALSAVEEVNVVINSLAN